MSYTLNLGSTFPYADGTIVSDISRYIGNNTFLRVVSQTNNNKTMIGLYSVDSIYTSTPVITTIHEQILFENAVLYHPRITVLGNGSFMIMGSYGSNNSVPRYSVVRYDDIGSNFVTEVPIRNFYETASNSNDLYTDFQYIETAMAYVAYERHYYNIFPYNNTSILYITQNSYQNSSAVSVGIIEDVYSDTEVNRGEQRLLKDTAIDNYYEPQYTNIKNYDGIVHITYSNYYVYCSSVIDLTAKSVLIQRSNNVTDIVKLDTDRYVALTDSSTGDLRYELDVSPQTVTSASIRFEPNAYLYSGYTDARIFRWTIPLDRFHAIHFRNTGASTIGAYVLKIVDENYGFVSDATVNGIDVITDNLFNDSQGESSQRTRLVSTTDGEWLKQLSATQFMIQTGYHTFQTFEITPTTTP